MSVDVHAKHAGDGYAEFQQCDLRGIALFMLGLWQSKLGGPRRTGLGGEFALRAAAVGRSVESICSRRRCGAPAGNHAFRAARTKDGGGGTAYRSRRTEQDV
jgi:hypothetical protein